MEATTTQRRPGDAGTLRWLDETLVVEDDPRTLVDSLVRELLAFGIPLLRVNVTQSTLHPEIIGYAYTWSRADDATTTLRGVRSQWSGEQYKVSPYALLVEQRVAGIRRRLDLPDQPDDFAILADLRAEGATDYVVMTSSFDIAGNTVGTWTTDRPGGFTSTELVTIARLLGILSRVLEARGLRSLALNPLDTYVGHRAGERILAGEIVRGSGESLEAVIWLSDLRGFTELSDAMPRDELIAMLNRYYDGIIGAVDGHGGEVLKFMGDGVLAIFPTDAAGGPEAACRAAVAATDAARADLATLNAERVAAGQAPFDYGIALHLGEVNFGNVGASNRLDFTVIGPAVNLASRLERLCAGVGEPVLVSETVAEHVPERVEAIGVRRLRGLRQPQMIHRLAAVPRSGTD